MGRLTGFNYKEIARKLRKTGYVFDRQPKGSHEIWINPLTRKRITVPNHPGDIPEGTLQAVLKTVEIAPEDFLKL